MEKIVESGNTFCILVTQIGNTFYSRELLFAPITSH